MASSEAVLLLPDRVRLLASDAFALFDGNDLAGGDSGKINKEIVYARLRVRPFGIQTTWRLRGRVPASFCSVVHLRDDAHGSPTGRAGSSWSAEAKHC